MANIRTFADLERESSGRPNAKPLPNPWGAGSSLSNTATPSAREQTFDPSLADFEAGRQQQYVKIVGIDGREQDVVVPYDQGPLGYLRLMCCSSCCPCFLPPLWSEERKRAYIEFFKSFCFVISLVQVIMLIVALAMGGVTSYSDNPSVGPGAGTLLKLGAKDGHLIRYDLELWRFITPIFLHAGIIHLLFNLLFQLRFGLFMERRWGLLCFVLIYFISGLGGNLLSCLIFFNTVSVGASTALMGLLGAYIADLLLKWNITPPSVRSSTLYPTLLLAVFVLVFSFFGSTFIDGAGHLGGFLVGLFLGGICFADALRHVVLRKVVFFGSIVCLVLYFVVGYVAFFTVAD